MPTLQVEDVDFKGREVITVQAVSDHAELRERNGKHYINIRYSVKTPGGVKHQYQEMYLSEKALPITARQLKAGFKVYFPVDVESEETNWTDPATRAAVLKTIKIAMSNGELDEKPVGILLKQEVYTKDGVDKISIKVGKVYPGGGKKDAAKEASLWAGLLGEPVQANIAAATSEQYSNGTGYLQSPADEDDSSLPF